MADQEFLASFGVEVDKAGVTRLQNVLSQNKELADQVAASFSAAAEAVRSYQKAVTEGDNPTGEGTRDDGTGKEPAGGTRTGTEGSHEVGRDDGSRSEAWKNYQANKDKWENNAAGHESRDLSGLKKQENTFLPSVKNEIESRLMGSLFGEEGTTRDWYLSNLEEYTRATITKDSSRLKDTLTSWEEYGLASDPAESGRSGEYGALQTQANDLLREPIAQARQIMQQALEAEANGEDTSGYADQIVELMKEPLQKVQELYDSFDFEDDPDYDENRNKDNGWKDTLTEDGEKPDTGHDEEYDPSRWKWNGEGWEEGAEEAPAPVQGGHIDVHL